MNFIILFNRYIQKIIRVAIDDWHDEIHSPTEAKENKPVGVFLCIPL